MSRYWRIYRIFFSSSLARELEFRANFLAKVLQNIVWIAFFLLIVVIIYRNTETVAGWNRGDAFILAATVFLLNAVTTGFFMALMEIPEQVRKGTLDFVITKPIDTQFWVSLRRFNFDQIGALAAGLVMLLYGVGTSGATPDAVQWIGYTIVALCAVVLFYSFSLALMTLGIWLVRVDNLWVLGETVMQVARYPLDIYGTGLQRFLTFYVPLAFIATVPAKMLVRGFDPLMLGLAVGWALASLLLARGFWNFALRSYTSASS